MWKVSADPYRFDAASQWFKDRLPVPYDEWLLMSAEARAMSFRVAAVTQADLVSDIWRALDKAVSEGTTFEDFKADIGERLIANWGGEIPGRLETIFRTNVQSAYSAGRQAEMADPDIADTRPFRRFVATLDTRTSPVCRASHDTVLLASDPWWLTHTPPLHHRCRSCVITLTPEQAAEMGLTAAPTPMDASKGFGNPLVEWSPDLTTYPDPIASQLAVALTEDAPIHAPEQTPVTHPRPGDGQ
jgi:SPP1 gp7 family putative phage head morphogenesis protein